MRQPGIQMSAGLAKEAEDYANLNLTNNNLATIQNGQYTVLKTLRGNYRSQRNSRIWKSQSLHIVWLITAYHWTYLKNVPQSIRKETLSYLLQFYQIKRVGRHSLSEILYAVQL